MIKALSCFVWCVCAVADLPAALGFVVALAFTMVFGFVTAPLYDWRERLHTGYLNQSQSRMARIEMGWRVIFPAFAESSGGCSTIKPFTTGGASVRSRDHEKTLELAS